MTLNAVSLLHVCCIAYMERCEAWGKCLHPQLAFYLQLEIVKTCDSHFRVIQNREYHPRSFSALEPVFYLIKKEK